MALTAMQRGFDDGDVTRGKAQIDSFGISTTAAHIFPALPPMVNQFVKLFPTTGGGCGGVYPLPPTDYNVLS